MGSRGVQLGIRPYTDDWHTGDLIGVLPFLDAPPMAEPPTRPIALAFSDRHAANPGRMAMA
jgi:hypothetical protein